MARTFIDMVQQANDSGWVVGDCFQLRHYEKWIWRVHLRDYHRSSEETVASVYDEGPSLEDAMAGCIVQMKGRIAEELKRGLARIPAKLTQRQALLTRLETALIDWCEKDPRFGKELTHRVRAMDQEEV